jgi:hypothetical protein
VLQPLARRPSPVVSTSEAFSGALLTAFPQPRATVRGQHYAPCGHLRVGPVRGRDRDCVQLRTVDGLVRQQGSTSLSRTRQYRQQSSSRLKSRMPGDVGKLSGSR